MLPPVGVMLYKNWYSISFLWKPPANDFTHDNSTMQERKLRLFQVKLGVVNPFTREILHWWVKSSSVTDRLKSLSVSGTVKLFYSDQETNDTTLANFHFYAETRVHNCASLHAYV